MITKSIASIFFVDSTLPPRSLKARNFLYITVNLARRMCDALAGRRSDQMQGDHKLNAGLVPAACRRALADPSAESSRQRCGAPRVRATSGTRGGGTLGIDSVAGGREVLHVVEGRCPHTRVALATCASNACAARRALHMRPRPGTPGAEAP